MNQGAHRGISLSFLLGRSLIHRRSRTVAELVALTVSAAVATALLTLYVSLDRKLHYEFRAFGANIVITAETQAHGGALRPGTLATARDVIGADGRVIPFAYAIAQMTDGRSIVVAGTDMDGVRAMNRWWQVSHWPERQSTHVGKSADRLEVLAGVRAQQVIGSDNFSLAYNGKTIQMHTAGTLRTGDADDSRIYMPLAAFETWTGAAPSTLQIQASGNTSQIQVILVRLRKALSDVNVHAVHQLVEAEANVVSRTRLLMLGSLLLISLTVAICVLATMTASVFERRRDFALMKALGATQRGVGLLFLLEAIALALGGLVCGYALGCGIAYLIGEWNFHTAILPVWQIVPQVAILNLVIAVLAAAVPLRILRRLEPAALLRGE